MRRLLQRLDALDARFHLGEPREVRWARRGGPSHWEEQAMRRPVLAIVIPYAAVIAVLFLLDALTPQVVFLALVLGPLGYWNTRSLRDRYQAWNQAAGT